MRKIIMLLTLLFATPAISADSSAPIADVIYSGGPIITMDDAHPSAEAVAVAGGRILAVGSKGDVAKFSGAATKHINLHGRALLPGFIDAHGHITLLATFASYVNLASPPEGQVTTIATLQARLKRLESVKNQGGWIIGAGYDDSLLVEHRHPTRADLDAVSTSEPILITHVSGHLGVANSKALDLAGITADTPDPKGGHIRRAADGKTPNGVLEESAMFALFSTLPAASLEQRLAALKKAQDIYASYGITTAEDGASGPGDVALLKDANARGDLYLDIVSFPLWQNEALIPDATATRNYDGHFRIGGVKLILDGSPQGKTAYLAQPYFQPPDGKDASYRGYPAMPDASVKEHIRHYYEKGIQIHAHANGDASEQQFIDAIADAQTAFPGRDARPVMVHAQTIRDDQLDRVKALGIIPTFFVAHTFYWGDWHRDSVLGLERASRISPAKSALDRNILFTFHNDAPVVSPDIMRLVWNGVTRQTRSGKILGENQRISVMDALKAVTINAAFQGFEEKEKGSLEAGKRADFVILTSNPLTVAPENLRYVRAVETIKDGKTVWKMKVQGR